MGATISRVQLEAFLIRGAGFVKQPCIPGIQSEVAIKVRGDRIELNGSTHECNRFIEAYERACEPCGSAQNSPVSWVQLQCCLVCLIGSTPVPIVPAPDPSD